MRPRRGQPAARTKIVAAGRELFASRGYAETSVGDIARLAEVARATVYNNFEDKQDVLVAVLGEYMADYARIPERLRRRARPGQTSFELVREAFRESVAWQVENADLQPIAAVARNLRGCDWEEASRDAEEAMLDWILTIHAPNRATGLLREGVDLELGVRAALATIGSVSSSIRACGGAAGVEAVADQLALLHWYSIYSIEPATAPRSPLAGATAVSV